MASRRHEMAAASERTKSQTDVPERLLSRDLCLAVVKEHAGHSDFLLEGWKEVHAGGEQPLGLLGLHLWAHVDVQWLGDAPRPQTLTFFVKALPANEAHCSFVEAIGAARKEFLYYAELEPAMRAALSPHRHDAAERRGAVAAWGCRCLLARRSLLVLEDLAAQGFRNGGARDEPSFAHALLVMRALASMHAHSLAFERTRDAQLGRCFRLNDFFPELFQETFYARGDGHQFKFTSSGVAALTACALLLPRCTSDATVAEAVRERLPTVLWRVCDLVQPSQTHRNALAHGDLWLNNILFRSGGDGQPADARLVDFQLARYQPPAFDVHQFLHVCCRSAFRQRHQHALLRAYHDQLQEQLAKALGGGGGRATAEQQLLPWTAFQASWPDARLFGRVVAPFFLHFIVTDEKVLGEVLGDKERYHRMLYDGRVEHAVTQFRTDPVYRERLSESLEELIDEHVLSSKGRQVKDELRLL